MQIVDPEPPAEPIDLDRATLPEVRRVRERRLSGSRKAARVPCRSILRDGARAAVHDRASLSVEDAPQQLQRDGSSRYRAGEGLGQPPTRAPTRDQQAGQAQVLGLWGTAAQHFPLPWQQRIASELSTLLGDRNLVEAIQVDDHVELTATRQDVVERHELLWLLEAADRHANDNDIVVESVLAPTSVAQTFPEYIAGEFTQENGNRTTEHTDDQAVLAFAHDGFGAIQETESIDRQGRGSVARPARVSIVRVQDERHGFEPALRLADGARPGDDPAALPSQSPIAKRLAIDERKQQEAAEFQENHDNSEHSGQKESASANHVTSMLPGNPAGWRTLYAQVRLAAPCRASHALE